MLSSYLAGFGAQIFPALAILLAAFLQAITGFGLVIVAAPLLMLFYARVLRQFRAGGVCAAAGELAAHRHALSRRAARAADWLFRIFVGGQRDATIVH